MISIKIVKVYSNTMVLFLVHVWVVNMEFYFDFDVTEENTELNFDLDASLIG